VVTADFIKNTGLGKITDRKIISLKKVSETLYASISFQTVLDVLLIILNELVTLQV